MRVVHLIGDRRLPPDPDRASASGVVRAALELAAAQVARGHAVTVAAVGRERWESAWRGVRLVARPGVTWAHGTVAGRSADFRSHLAYMLYLARLRPDVVHAHNYYYLRFLRARRRVVHFHADPLYRNTRGTRTDFAAADFDLVGRHSDAQVANSHYVAGQVRRGLGDRAHVHTVYCGVDLDRFDGARAADRAAELRAGWEYGPSETVFLYAGAIVPEKGVLHLARAFSGLGRPDARLVVAGARDLWGGAIHREDDGGYDQLVYAALAASAARGHVRFLGNLPADAMAAAYAAADVLVVPSVWPEAFGMVALEAAACGRPVIASAVGGLAEIVTPEFGIQVPPGDEDALRDAMRALVDDAGRRRGLAARARTEAGAFRWDVAAAQVDAVYGPAATPRAPADEPVPADQRRTA